MGWTTLLTTVAASALGAHAATTPFNLTLDGFSSMITYDQGWTSGFDGLPSNAGQLALARGQGYHTSPGLSGGNVWTTFVGTGVSVYGHYGFLNGTTTATIAPSSPFHASLDLFIDGSNLYIESTNGNVTKDIIRIATQAGPGTGLHEMKLTVNKGPLTVTSVEVALEIPVSESDWESTKQITQLFTTDDGKEVSPDVVTTGDWTAEAQTGSDSKIQNPHMRTEAAGASISYVMGTGNAFMMVSGNAGYDRGGFTIDVDPPPYLRNGTEDYSANAPYTVPNTTYYAVALEPEKNYTLTLTNLGNDTARPAFEVNSVTMWKLASALKDDEASGNGTSTGGASGSGNESGGKKSGVSAGAIAGGVVGGFAAAAGLAAALFFFMKRRKAKQRQEEWEKSRDPGGQLDVDGGDNITPFMAAAPPGSTYPENTLSPNNRGPNTNSMISSDPSSWEMNSMSNTNSYYGGPQSANAPYLQPLLAGQQTTAVGALPAKRGIPMDQPAPQLPQDTDAGPIMDNHDMIPPSYDPSWSAAGSRISTATSNDFNVSPTGYNPGLPDVDENAPNAAAGSSSQPPPASSWPQDRKDPRDFQ